jgi:sugar O-acyltransferase (sialic acid O-acetyltransferase NeuD family)
VIDTLFRLGWSSNAITVRDANPARAAALVLGCVVHCPDTPDLSKTAQAHMAIGSNAARRALAKRLGGPLEWLSIVHPLASVAYEAQIGDGSFIASFAVVGPSSCIGSHAIINHGAVVDHDCRVGDFSHIAPNATLGGGVIVGQSVLIGAGAVVLPGLEIGDGAIIGAGAVVTRTVPAGETWVGNPAAGRLST